MAHDAVGWGCCYCHKHPCICDPNDARVRDHFYDLLPIISQRIRDEGVPLRLEPFEVHVLDQMAAMGKK
jgi:hypothetical protein